MAVIIEVSKVLEKQFDLEVSNDLDSDGDYYLSSFELSGKDIGLIIEKATYFSTLFEIQKPFTLSQVTPVSSCYIELVYSDNASEIAKIRTITQKAKSICTDSNSALIEAQKLLNGIPWKFLGFSTPSELKQQTYKKLL